MFNIGERPFLVFLASEGGGNVLPAFLDADVGIAANAESISVFSHFAQCPLQAMREHARRAHDNGTRIVIPL